MATLYIAVWTSATEVALGDPIQEMAVSIGAGSVQSAEITADNRKRRRVRLMADSACFVTWGLNPTATNDGTSGRPLGAENPEYFDIESGHLIAVIERT